MVKQITTTSIRILENSPGSYQTARLGGDQMMVINAPQMCEYC